MGKRIFAPLCWAIVIVASCCVNVWAQTDTRKIDELTNADAEQFFTDVIQLGKVTADIKARPVFGRSGLQGYIFLTGDLAPIPAYSGKPVSVLVGIDTQGTIKGAKIHHQEEPILVIGITPADLQNYTQQYIGLSAYDKVRINAHDRPGYIGVDGITGATISLMVINRSIMKSALAVTQFFADQQKNSQGGEGQSQNQSTTVGDDENYWLQQWENRPLAFILLALALAFLLVILFFQDWLVVHTKLFERIRNIYLLFVVVVVGYYLGAQLSIMNLLTFAKRMGEDFSWMTLMIDPAIFMLWGFVAISILLWGRGVFCGWLCPFGALQELIHKVGERFNCPSFKFSPMVHERLWAIKYFILIALVGLSLDSMVSAAKLAEIEPFKTSFSMLFQREWWFVAYAVALLVMALFNSKFYCKYLCPLGAALSVLGRYQIFQWLRRRNECGSPCQACASTCQIGAIKVTGEIVQTECHYCLQCQVLYWDEHTCPPLVSKRVRKEQREAKAKKRNEAQLIHVQEVDDTSETP